ncbi:hypothetical protein NMY22_g10209 [Coprinellus aureogranulatus]|nr:hypothetical protein NMY22_g10209 [Coprinellus aureogranulatus]
MSLLQQAQQEGLCLNFPEPLGVHREVSLDTAVNTLVRAPATANNVPFQWRYIDKPNGQSVSYHTSLVIKYERNIDTESFGFAPIPKRRHTMARSRDKPSLECWARALTSGIRSVRDKVWVHPWERSHRVATTTQVPSSQGRPSQFRARALYPRTLDSYVSIINQSHSMITDALPCWLGS